MSEYDEQEVEEHMQAVREFLSSAGAIGILREIDHTGGKRFTDLEEVVPVSTSTLTTRIDEAEALGILVHNYTMVDGRRSIVYEKTKVGRRIRQRMQDQQLIRIYDDLVELQAEFDSEVEGLQDWVYEQMPYLTGTPPGDVDFQ
jgi:DNA-binding HxlR family transcriptional regulator